MLWLKVFSHSHRALARCKSSEDEENRFNGFRGFASETVKTVSQKRVAVNTGLKPGENERRLLMQSYKNIR
jgi:hypothetical protein